MLAGQVEQVRAHRVQPVVPGQRGVASPALSSSASPASGPCTMATATIRFSVTIGAGASSRRRS